LKATDLKFLPHRIKTKVRIDNAMAIDACAPSLKNSQPTNTMKKNYHLPTTAFLLFSFTFIPAAFFAQAGRLDLTFDPGTGANNPVYTTSIQSDQSILIGGNFTTFNGVSRTRIARVLSNGTLDASFDVGTGASNTVEKIIQSNGKVLVGGWFTSYDGVGRNRMMSLNDNGSVNTNFAMGNAVNPYIRSIVKETDFTTIIGGNFSALTTGGASRKCIARIDVNGVLDPTFNPGTGANSAIAIMAYQSTGKLIIVGAFTTYNGIARQYIARVNSDGSLDATFNPGTGPNQQITSMGIQDDGKIIIGGFFTSYNGFVRNRIARLNLDGSLDGTFDPGTGASASVSALVLQPDGKVIIAGDFTSYNGTPRSKIARLHFSGALDTSFDPGYGPGGGNISTMEMQFNGRIIIGGLFTSYDGTTRNHIARIYGEPALGTEERADLGKNVSLYPNPTQDYTTIESRNTRFDEDYTIFNLMGQKVLSGRLTGGTAKVDVSMLSSGTYLIKAGNYQPVKLIRQ
jgi:uncharacterized delta-60 repeat protein